MSEWHSQVETETQNAGEDLPTPAAAHGAAVTASELNDAAGQDDAGQDEVAADVASEGPAADHEPQLIERLSERLRELDELPVSEHPARYEALHSELSEALTVLDRAAQSDAGPGQQRR